MTSSGSGTVVDGAAAGAAVLDGAVDGGLVTLLEGVGIVGVKGCEPPASFGCRPLFEDEVRFPTA